MSVTLFYTIVWRTIDAVNATIKIAFPKSAEECALAAAGFEKVSYNGVIKNCVGAVDGYLLAIQTPPKTVAKNVRSFFSGHYQKYGVNVQACCDVNCRFTFLGLGGPGVTNDRVGVEESGLAKKIESLPSGYVVIGDCAYQPTEKLIPIFGGDLALRPDNNNFNFFASQLRIRIEMAFGMMTRKWGILQRPLTNGLRSVKDIIFCIARLHNFCIDERLKRNTNDTFFAASTSIENFPRQNFNDSLSVEQLAYMYAAAEAENLEITSYEYPQWSFTREELVKTIKEQGLKRPTQNSLRKRKLTPTSAPTFPSFPGVEQVE